MSALDARAVLASSRSGQPGTVPTDVYRGLLARSLYSRCKMFPSDSQVFDLRAPACGSLGAAVLGMARLFLEEEASPKILPVTFADGRIRWWDLPRRGDCAP